MLLEEIREMEKHCDEMLVSNEDNFLNDYDLTIYIMTHNRPEMLIDVICALEKQTYKQFKLVISDNSDNLDTKKNLERAGIINKVEYTFRKQTKDHFNTILNEVSSDYFMILHDDDIPCPSMVEKLYKAIKSDAYVAVSANAYKIYNTVEF